MTVGYVVVCKGSPLCTTDSYGSRDGIGPTLAFGSVGSLFKTRRAAAKAIQHTLRYKALYDLPWPSQEEYKIIRLITE